MNSMTSQEVTAIEVILQSFYAAHYPVGWYVLQKRLNGSRSRLGCRLLGHKIELDVGPEPPVGGSAKDVSLVV